MAGTSRGRQKAGAADGGTAAGAQTPKETKPPEGPEGSEGSEAPEGAQGSEGGVAPDPVPGSPERDQRTPSTTVVPSAAGPLVPTDIQKVNKPEGGHPESSTNPVAANAAQRSVPGSNFVRLTDAAGNEIDVDDVFTGPVGPSRMVTAQTRVYQTFTYPHARTPTTQLLYPKGARIPMAEAERFKASVKAFLKNA